MRDKEFEQSEEREVDSLSEFSLEDIESPLSGLSLEDVEKSLTDSLSPYSPEEIEQLVASYLSEVSLENIKNILEEAPAEITTGIFSFLPVRMLATLSLTNKFIAELAKDNVLWKMKFAQCFPHQVNGLSNQSNINWYKEFREAYVREITAWPKELRKIAAAIIESDIASLKKMNLNLNLLDKKYVSTLFDLAKKVGNQLVLDHFYQQIERKYQGQGGEILDKRWIDPQGRSLLYWRIVCNQSIDVNSIASQLDTLCGKGLKPLHCAAREGRLGLVQEILKVRPDLLDSLDDANQTALLWAAVDGQSHVVDYLISLNAKLGVQTHSRGPSSSSGMTALHWAAKAGHLEVVKLLLKAGADPKARSSDGAEPLHYAAKNGNVEIIKLLLAAGANVRAEDNDKSQPLFIAMLFNRVDAAKQLIAEGAELNVESLQSSGILQQFSQYQSPERYAELLLLISRTEFNPGERRSLLRLVNLIVVLGHLEIIKLMVEYQPDLLNKNNDFYQTVLLATQAGQTSIVSYFIEHNEELFNAETKNKLLLVAMKYHHPDLMALMLEKGADPLIRDEQGRGVIHNFASLRSLSSNSLKAVHTLIEQNPELLNEVLENNENLLHCAAKCGNQALVAYFIEKKADLEVESADGYRALHLAACNGYSDVVSLLIAAGAKSDARTTGKLSLPIHLAAEQGYIEVMKVLIEGNPQALIEKNNEGYTPLVVLANYCGDLRLGEVDDDLYDFLRDQIHEQTKQLKSPEERGLFLYELFSKNYSYLFRERLPLSGRLTSCFKLVGDINLIKNENGETLLHHLAKEWYAGESNPDNESFQFVTDFLIPLMKQGANPAAENNDGFSALDITDSPTVPLMFGLADKDIQLKRYEGYKTRCPQLEQECRSLIDILNANNSMLHNLQKENSGLRQENEELHNQVARLQEELQRTPSGKRKSPEPGLEEIKTEEGQQAKKTKVSEDAGEPKDRGYKRKHSHLEADGKEKEKKPTKIKRGLSSLENLGMFQSEKIKDEQEEKKESQEKINDDKKDDNYPQNT
ncbi:ankyrin repeat domain-containing protein [Legionella fallonii]|uniref:F-box domain-containing protein n=1 Tax=Legionella fallonii LLAP-10 TaxID=1212491 RepID=A0A098G0Y8_9GAMM|nr:ankyrin repeat domain-containing protein [Legionella fallonii]CEG56142.1 protein of unknown function [ankyrin domain][F-box domain] [Legionella fallonii LLAP-10]